MNIAGAALRVLLLAMAALTCGVPAALAENFPSWPIYLILPYAPGGIIEFVGRTLSQKLGEVLHQPVVVEERPGAGGIVGVDYVARAAPDGYNIVLVDPAIVTNPTLHKSLPYDIFKDLVAISIVATAPEVLVVAPQLGVKTHAALLAYGKANPGKLNYASAGIGSYAAPCRRDVEGAGRHRRHTRSLQGHRPGLHRPDGREGADVVFQPSRRHAVHCQGQPHCHCHDRAQASADVSRFADGVRIAAGLCGRLWLGIYGTAGTPPDVLATLNSGLDKALQRRRVQAAFAKFGIAPRGTTVQEGAAFTKEEYEKWRKVITDAHITLD